MSARGISHKTINYIRPILVYLIHISIFDTRTCPKDIQIIASLIGQLGSSNWPLSNQTPHVYTEIENYNLKIFNFELNHVLIVIFKSLSTCRSLIRCMGRPGIASWAQVLARS